MDDPFVVLKGTLEEAGFKHFHNADPAQDADWLCAHASGEVVMLSRHQEGIRVIHFFKNLMPSRVEEYTPMGEKVGLVTMWENREPMYGVATHVIKDGKSASHTSMAVTKAQLERQYRLPISQARLYCRTMLPPDHEARKAGQVSR